MANRAINTEMPGKLRGLRDPYRYKIAYGGRGGCKSWGFARTLLLMGNEQPLRILCARELQNSLAESVHKLLSTQIDELGLTQTYEVQNNRIFNAFGTEFIFEGLHANTNKIKSMEDIDICWVEEAEKVTSESWSILIPTIRKQGSEIWITFNPGLESDAVWQRFIVNPPPRTFVVQLNWQDNRWLSDELRAEKDHLERTDYESYLHIWEGRFRKYPEGAIYKQEMLDAERSGRICKVDYDQLLPVHTVWDIGVGDCMAILMVQLHRSEVRIVDCIEDSGKGVDHYIRELQKKPYVYGEDWLPHDGASRDKTTALSPKDMMARLGRNVRLCPRLDVDQGINAVRVLFPRIWMDKEKAAVAISRFQHYRRELNPKLNEFKPMPVHDINSHMSDALRGLALVVDKMTNSVRDLPPVHIEPFVPFDRMMGV